MFVALVILHVTVSIVLVFVVLLQAGRGAELGAAFGGLGQATYGRMPATPLAKVTTGLAVVFMLTSLTLAFIANERPSASALAPSAMAPEAQAPAPAQGSAPATPTQPGQAQTPALPQAPAPSQTEAPPRQ
jgi:preprotein translocase subunit SecG